MKKLQKIIRVIDMDTEAKICEYKYDTNLAKTFYHEKDIEYHLEFFKAGFNAIVKKWLYGGCKEITEEKNIH